MEAVKAHRTVSWRHELAIALLAVSFVAFHLGEVIQHRMLAGWDLPGHYYLYTVFLDNFKEGRLVSYDTGWFAGFEAFRFYSPLAYLLFALPHLLSFSFISPLLSFNLVLFFLPLLFVAACYSTGRALYGREVGCLAALGAVLFLAVPRSYALMGIGMSTLTYAGLIPGFVGVIGFLLLLAQLRAPLSPKRALAFGAGLGVLTLTHILTTLFTAFVVALFLLFAQRQRRALISALIALGWITVAGFWVLPFVDGLWRTSAQGQGMWDALPDPLLVLFPDLSVAGLRRAFAPLLEGGGHGWWQTLSATFSSLVLDMPWFSVLLLVAGGVGFVTLMRERCSFVPLAFALGLLLLPRELLPHMHDTKVHFYRFQQHLFVLNLLIAARGMRSLLAMPRMKMAATLLGTVALVAALIGYRPHQARYDNPFGHYPSYTFIDQYPAFADARKVLNFLRTLPAGSRVIAESLWEDNHLLGTPHFFTFAIAAHTELEVMPGLIVESSPSTMYLQPALAIGSLHLPWGRRRLLGIPEFNRQSVPSMLRRLSLFGASHLITTSRIYYLSLLESPEELVGLVFQAGSYAVFELRQHRPRFYTPTHAPVLYLERGGARFRHFSELAYIAPELAGYPFIYHPENALPPNGTAQLGGVIVSLPPASRCGEEVAALARATRVVVLGGRCEIPGVLWLHDVTTARDRRELALFLGAEEGMLSVEPLSGTFREELISVQGRGPVAINYSYAPGWSAIDASTPVYLLHPSMMLVFADGDVALRYE